MHFKSQSLEGGISDGEIQKEVSWHFPGIFRVAEEFKSNFISKLMIYWDKGGIQQCDGLASQAIKVSPLFKGFRSQRKM